MTMRMEMEENNVFSDRAEDTALQQKWRKSNLISSISDTLWGDRLDFSGRHARRKYFEAHRGEPQRSGMDGTDNTGYCAVLH